MSKPDFIVGAQVFSDLKACAMKAGQKVVCKGYSMILEDGYVIRVSPHLKPDEIVAETERSILAMNTLLERYRNEDTILPELTDDVDGLDLY